MLSNVGKYWFCYRSAGTAAVGHVHYCNVTMRSWIAAGQNDSHTLQILAPGFSGAKPGVKGPSNTHDQNNTIAAFLLARGRNTVLSFLPNENGWSLASDYGTSAIPDFTPVPENIACHGPVIFAVQ